MNINKRLYKISNYIDDNSNVIDVGCDHSLLGIYLVLNRNNVRVISSDVVEMPLIQAKKNIKKYNVSENIEVKLGYGLSTISEEIDTVVISGMGGENIIEILNKGKDLLKNVEKIILSPNNKSYELRKYLSNNGFKIEKEEIVFDNNKYYPIILVNKGNGNYTEEELLYGYCEDVNNDLISYYNYLIKTYEGILKKIPKDYIEKKKSIKKYIDYLKDKI